MFVEFLKESNTMNYVHSVEDVDYPDGIYDGIRGGYVVKIKGTDISFKTDTGIRCSNCPCKIQITNKKAILI